MDDVRAVMDAAGSGRAALLGASEGGPMSILFAATYPQRVRALILYGAYAHFHTWVMGRDALAQFDQHQPGNDWLGRHERINRITCLMLSKPNVEPNVLAGSRLPSYGRDEHFPEKACPRA
jgi:pimeloyl-ACP methyl ester carboxylesterase